MALGEVKQKLASTSGITADLILLIERDKTIANCYTQDKVTERDKKFLCNLKINERTQLRAFQLIKFDTN